MVKGFCVGGKISFILGGQFGSEGKGAAAAWAVRSLAEGVGKDPDNRPFFDVVTTNAGVQSGHTSIHNGRKRVLFHLPTAGVMLTEEYDQSPIIYLNAGSVIDPKVLRDELEQTWPSGIPAHSRSTYPFAIHPNAAVVTDECREAEGRADSAQTKIASTRKGVGEAISRKVLRSGLIARNHPWLSQFVREIDLNKRLAAGAAVLCEVPQGVGLSLNSQFYPYTTSRDCTVMQAMSDARVHPSFMGQTMLVLRTFPIRVGNIIQAVPDPDGRQIAHVLGSSGGVYPDQVETTWESLGVEAEITTVTKRVRRVFTWSRSQLREALALCRPEIVYLSFCDYVANMGGRVTKFTEDIHEAAHAVGLPGPPQIVYSYGPSTDDVKEWGFLKK